MAMLVAACNPTFNWRDVRLEPSMLKAALPCKPEQASRPVPMAGRQVELKVLGCEAGGVTFALLSGDIVEPLRAGEVLAQWQSATLSNLRSSGSLDRPFLPNGAMALRQSVRVVAQGLRADGSKVHSQAAYFARGSQVFQAVIYADRIDPQAADPFFAALAFE